MAENRKCFLFLTHRFKCKNFSAICLLFSVLCPLFSAYAACDKDDKECYQRDGDLIINRHMLDDPIYRKPAVPLLVEHPGQVLSAEEKKNQKVKKPYLHQNNTHQTSRSDYSSSIKKPDHLDQAIQNTVRSNPTQNHKSELKPDTHLIATSGLRLVFPIGITLLDQNAQASLNQLIKVLYDHPSWRINLYGYAGPQVNYTDQMRLAFDRIQLVKAHLIQNGIEPNRLHLYVIGASNDLPYDRIDITMIKEQ